MARLVTLRYDKDAIGAMAVLMLRGLGKDHRIDKMLVSWIGALDRMPYRDAREKYPELAEMHSKTITDVMNYAVHSSGWYLPRKVSVMAQLLCREISKEKISTMAEKAALVKPKRSDFPVEMQGRVAYICAPNAYSAARAFGNKNFEVVVIYDPERETESGGKHERWCVIRQAQPIKTFDRSGFEHAINDAEASKRGISRETLREQAVEWGGPPNMVVSPQGAGHETMLSKDEILTLVRAHLESGVVS